MQRILHPVFNIIFASRIHHSRYFWNPFFLLNPASSPLESSHTAAAGQTAQKIFDGLLVVSVGLIIFVAESIRDAGNPDRKRVLLRISFLWPLALALTLFPLGYLVGELTGMAVALAISIAFLSILA